MLTTHLLIQRRLTKRLIITVSLITSLMWIQRAAAGVVDLIIPAPLFFKSNLPSWAKQLGKDGSVRTSPFEKKSSLPSVMMINLLPLTRRPTHPCGNNLTPQHLRINCQFLLLPSKIFLPSTKIKPDRDLREFHSYVCSMSSGGGFTSRRRRQHLEVSRLKWIKTKVFHRRFEQGTDGGLT